MKKTFRTADTIVSGFATALIFSLLCLSPHSVIASSIEGAGLSTDLSDLPTDGLTKIPDNVPRALHRHTSGGIDNFGYIISTDVLETIELYGFYALFSDFEETYLDRHHGYGDKGHGDKYVAPIPIPSSVWLFGAGLIGFTGFAKRRRKF